MTDQLNEQLSAFMDGELPDEECELFVRQLCKDAELGQTVNRYALIGDAMRGELLAADTQLSQRIRAGLDEALSEPTSSSSSAPGWLRPVSGVAVAASVAAVAVMSLQGFGGPDNSELPASTVADISTDSGAALVPVNVPQLTLPEVRPASVMPQSRMDQYLLRHREYANGFGRQSVMGIRDLGNYSLVPIPAQPADQQDEARQE